MILYMACQLSSKLEENSFQKISMSSESIHEMISWLLDYFAYVCCQVVSCFSCVDTESLADLFIMLP